MTGKSLSQAAVQRREIGTVAHRLRNNEKQLQLYQGYRIKLEQLKSKYWNAGLKKGVQPVKQREKREGYVRKRLLPVILTGSMQSTPSMQLMKRDEVKGLKLSSNMERDIDTVEEVKQGKKRPNFMEPEWKPVNLIVGWSRRFLFFVAPHQFQDIGEWPHFDS